MTRKRDISWGVLILGWAAIATWLIWCGLSAL